jgi:hypothetical protein
MAEDKVEEKPKRVPKPGTKAAKLLEEAALILYGVRGKNAEAYKYIAVQVDWCREKVLENL